MEGINYKMEKKNELLDMERKACFPLYVASREMTKMYKPYLDKYDLTYTQYLSLIMLFDNESLSVKDLGKKLYLDSGTLTPLLKKLENKGYITRTRFAVDNRFLNVALTEKGEELRAELTKIPQLVLEELGITESESEALNTLVSKLVNTCDE